MFKRYQLFSIICLLCSFAGGAYANDAAIEKLPLEVMKPKIRVISNGNDKYSINTKLLRPYLTENFILTKEDKKKKFPLVHSFFNRHLIGGPGAKIFIKGFKTEEYSSYMFVKKDKTFFHPVTKENLGTQYIVLGEGKVLEFGELATMEIGHVNYPIEKGEKLIPKKDFVLPEIVNGKVLKGNKQGYVLASTEELKNVGKFHSIIVSLGEREGVAVGDILSIYRMEKEDLLIGIDGPYSKKSKVKLQKDPLLTKQGEIMIYRTFEKLSQAIVLSAHTPITVYDLVKAEQ